MGINFHTYPLRIADGNVSATAKGSLVVASSFKSHRHRKGEVLALQLDFSEPALIAEEEIKEIIAGAGKKFFETPGSVTNALQTAVASVNTALFERNLAPESVEPARATGCFIVSHNGYLFTAQTGASHIFLIGADSFVHLQNQDDGERGLGSARRFLLNFQQLPLTSGDLIMLSTRAPLTWDENHLKNSQQLSMEQVYRRLLDQVNIDLNAMVIKCKEGKGLVQEEQWSVETPALSSEAGNVEQIEEQAAVQEKTEQDYIPAKVEEQVSPTVQHRTSKADHDLTLGQFFPEMEEETLNVEPGRPERIDFEKRKTPLEGETRKGKKSEYVKSRIPSKQGTEKKRSSNALQTLFLRISNWFTADSTPLESNAPTRLLSTAVIIVPLVLITMAVLVYVYSGRREQHQVFLDEAQSYITQATTIEDAAQQREYWTRAYETVLKAMEFGDSDLANTLLVQTQTVIDDMDLVTRLDFRPATTSQFSQNVVLTKIKSNESGIYLLDATAGSVYRAIANSRGFYEIDSTFRCSPGTYGVITLGKIVDFTTLPTNTRSFEILAVDAGGNVLYCLSGSDPVPSSLIPPASEWGKIGAISLDEYTLYVMDVEKDGIWSYSGSDFEIAAMAGIVFNSHPVDFLGAEEVDLGGAMDLIVNKEDVFILHQDSHMTTCQYNPYREGNATECQDPTAYGDSRIGYEKNPLVYFDAQFNAIQETTYPTSAFYILDSANRAVLQYSYQLNLERTLKPQPSKTYPLPETEMSGVGVYMGKELFLAFGNQLYVGKLP